jgi:hypothetical protein
VVQDRGGVLPLFLRELTELLSGALEVDCAPGTALVRAIAREGNGGNPGAEAARGELNMSRGEGGCAGVREGGGEPVNQSDVCQKVTEQR